MSEPPKPPPDLGRSGREMWSALVRYLDFDAHEIRLLHEAARASDRCDELDRALKEQGPVLASGRPTYDQSRITRNVSDLQLFRDALLRHGALFIEAATGRVLDPADEDQELGSNVLGSVDQHYRRKVARRVRDSLMNKASGGDLVGVPAGYVRRRTINEANGHATKVWVEIEESSAAIIRTIFRDYATGAFSFKSRARSLNTRGVQPPQKHSIGRGARPAGSAARVTL